MVTKNSRTLIASAVSLALSSMMLAGSLNAGTIVGAMEITGPTTTTDPLITGVASWDQANVSIFKVTDVDTPLEAVAALPFTLGELQAPINTLVSDVGDSFFAKVYAGVAGASTQMARLSGKDWPVGGPTGIKAVNEDIYINNGKPFNCLINTGFLEGSFLDSLAPKPVVCSSGFQSHKRFKVTMLEATVDAVANGDAGKPVDLVINVADDAESTNGDGFRHYQVFSKINNYTGKRLKGYKIIVGTGIGAGFVPASDALGVGTDKLSLSLGVDEGSTDSTPAVVGVKNVWDPVYDGSDIFAADEMATFSHGLFGAIDGNFLEPGFFDDTTAGFLVSTSCQTGVACPTGPFPNTTDGAATVSLADTIESGAAIPSNYVNFFGDWLPSVWAPQGLFTPDPVDPEADPTLEAWWNGTAWIKYDANYNPVQLTRAEYDALITAGATIGVIEDVLNLGPNYIVKVGDGITGGKVTIRIVPVVADAQTAPAWVNTTPVPPAVVASSDDGGCTIGSNNRFDPLFPALVAMGLGYFGLRRFKASK